MSTAFDDLYGDSNYRCQQPGGMYKGWPSFKPEVIANAAKMFADYKLEDKDPSVAWNRNGTIAFEWECIHGLVNLEVGATWYSISIVHPELSNKIILARVGSFPEVAREPDTILVG